ncbi:MAG: hypothetical protein EZS28_015890 [Streblomastix strix]|uniref:Uncharacterized protein n=1 Tax=Streblomastix strix TaxID=222440 RepID=A0A5J4W292_9EUKA|nr:MAG: hypothetical protein EZS28_015890 [Streblomastix strix]
MQNQEMEQKIRKYKGQHVDEIEIKTSLDGQTLLLFPFVDEVKFIDGVRCASKRFQHKREIVDIDAIIEELEHHKNGSDIITYQYRLPREDTAQTHIPRNIQQRDDIEEYRQYIRAEITEILQVVKDSCRDNHLVLYGSYSQSITSRYVKKRYVPNFVISLAREYLVEILDLPFKAKSRQMTKYLKTFEFLDDQKYSQIITQKQQVNQNIYFYDEDSKAYYQGMKIIFMEYDTLQLNEQFEISTADILIVQASNLQNAFAIANKEALTGLKFCPFCQENGFANKSSNYSRDYERHIVKCEQIGGKLVKAIKLNQIQKPYVPHIVQNKTYIYLLAHGREQEFKPTQYYITYDLETVEKIVNKSFGKSSKQISELIPLKVASTTKNKTGVKTIYYDLPNGDDFLKQWLQNLFNEAVIVQQNNQYRTLTSVIDKAMQYNIDVPEIGFNSSKFEFFLFFKNL